MHFNSMVRPGLLYVLLFSVTCSLFIYFIYNDIFQVNKYVINGDNNPVRYVQSLVSDYIAKFSFKNRQNEEIQAGNYLFVLNLTTKCYEYTGKPPIWIYWDKDKIPMFGKILVDAIQCMNPEFHVFIVHDSNMMDFWPDCPVEIFQKLIPAHKADVVRVNLLKIYGGIFMDIDTFPTQSFYMYYELLETYDLVGSDWQGIGPIAMGFLGPSRAGIPFFKVWSKWQLESMHRLIATNSTTDPFGWPELLAYIAGPLADHMIRNKILNFYNFRGHQTVGQLIGRNLAHGMLVPLTNLTSPLYNLTDTPILFLHHAGVAAKVDSLTLKELLYPVGGDNVFTYFVKCAMMHCYTNLTDTELTYETEHGKIHFSEYSEFVATGLPYKCYEFNDTVVPKIVVPKKH